MYMKLLAHAGHLEPELAMMEEEESKRKEEEEKELEEKEAEFEEGFRRDSEPWAGKV